MPPVVRATSRILYQVSRGGGDDDDGLLEELVNLDSRVCSRLLEGIDLCIGVQRQLLLTYVGPCRLQEDPQGLAR